MEGVWALELMPVMLVLLSSYIKVKLSYLFKSQFTLTIDILLRHLKELMWEAQLLSSLTYFREKLWVFSCSLISQFIGSHNIKRNSCVSIRQSKISLRFTKQDTDGHQY